MTIAKRFVDNWTVVGVVIAGLCCFALPSAMQAQQSYNAVWQNSTSLTSSSAFVDASALCSGVGGTGGTNNCSGVDFCSVLASALDEVKSTSGVSTSGVVDARGVLPYVGGSVGGHQDCDEDPFGPSGANISLTNTYPITVLLPASNIRLHSTGWTLPSNVRLVGEGQYTNLTAYNFSSTDILDMGGTGCSPNPCSGISIEHLTLSGYQSGSAGNTQNGIVNQYAQQSSYVNDVSLSNIGGIGIKVTSNGTNSGPYSNINFVADSLGNNGNCSGGVAGTCPVCVDIEAQTRGIHGATCIGAGGVTGYNTGNDVAGASAVYVNASNNTVENIHIEGFWDGIEVGETTNAVGNVVIANITGAFGGSGYVNNVVHICGAQGNTGLGKCATYSTANVSDVTVLHATDGNNGGGTGSLDTSMVEDDVTGTTLNPYSGSKTGATVGMYILGEPIGGGYSRFTSNPGANLTGTSGSAVATWGAGGTAPGSSCASPTSVPGAVYSNTSGVTNSSIYVCSGGTWQSIL
jgi:hypothetical protein